MNTPTSTAPSTPKAPKRARVRQFELPYQPFEYDTFGSEEEEEELRPVWTEEEWGSEWPIRRGYATYTLEDVAREECAETLEQWLKLFTPSGQPQNDIEFFYVQHMALAITAKLDALKNKVV